MSNGQTPKDGPAGSSREEEQSALFANLVVQQANMATLLMGKAPHPETGKTFKDLEAARLFIDQLEMLEAKTKGNLTSNEAALLKQSLMSLRLAFVEAVESPVAEPSSEAAKKPADAPTSAATPSAEEQHKKFSKKY